MKQDEKSNLKAIQRQINQAVMRIHNIRKRNTDCKKQIMTNRQLTSRVLAQKQHMALSMIQQQRRHDKLKMEEKIRIQSLKRRNFDQKKKHQVQIRDIMTALHMVKANQALQLKRISKQHNQKLRQMSDSQLQKNKQIKIRIKSQEGKCKQAYWKQKLFRLYSENQNQKMERSQLIAQRFNKLGQLLQHSRSLQKQYELTQHQHMTARRQYHSAIALPVRNIASSIKSSNPQILKNMGQYDIDEILDSQLYQEYENGQKKHHAFSSISTKLSEEKLKIILEKLRQKKNNLEQTKQMN